MKYALTLCTLLLIALAAPGCQKNPRAIIELPTGPEYAGEYLETSDVRHIGYALQNARLRTPVQWENPNTGYQYSLLIFTSDKTGTVYHSTFTVLTIAPDGTAEVLNLAGTSEQDHVWKIVAQAPAAPVGKAARMQLGDTPAPAGTLSSGQTFDGFIVIE